MAGKTLHFTIPRKDHAELSRWLRQGSLSQQLGFRARVILLLAEGLSVTAVANQLQTTRKTVHEWRARYLAEGVEGLRDKSRPGRPTVLTDEVVERILQQTVTEIPQESTHWSVRLMAKYAGVTTWQVRQVWAAADLLPIVSRASN
jgi:transposase